ncbi:Hypothetical protein, putative [Bodo saltans]|uniref:Uncharacterized protein n=1 Tax=Bodo saltans TaxID=75058 RepID=A0A0S4J1W2_BODSA|nr:Hypothetical protein, putative [Bodo saltans]|eukprot:CUG35968.1 Hypothetical protein, putative [Bodo saltans]
MNNGFEHNLPSVRHHSGSSPSASPYYLAVYEQLFDCVARNELSQVAQCLRERAAEMSPLRGPFSEAEVVAAHTELISKELYHAVSQYSCPMTWSPTSAYKIMCKTREEAEDDPSMPPMLQPTKTFLGPQLPCYRVHDELARVAEQPARKFVKPDMWEYRQATMREFLTPAKMLAAQAIVDDMIAPSSSSTSSSSFAFDDDDNNNDNAGSLLKCIHGFHQLAEDRRTWVHFGDGLMLHVWRIPSEARRLVSAAQKVWQTLFEYSLHPYGTLVTALLFIKGMAVTFTQLPPLLPVADVLPTDDHDLHACTSSAVARCLAALIGSSYYTRGNGASTSGGEFALAQLPNTRLHVGADGRYYFMYPMALGIFLEEVGNVPRQPSEGGSYLQAPLRPEVYYHVLPKGTSYRYTQGELIKNIRDGPCTVAAETILRTAQPKLTEMVTQQQVTATMHSLGVNMKCLYIVHQQLQKIGQGGKLPGTATPELLAVAMDAVIVEMLCRTVKSIIRLELSASQLSPVSAKLLVSPSSASSDISANRVNRFMEWLVTGEKEIWEDQILVILRRKFIECPPTFTIPFHMKYFRVLLWYLAPKLGAAYDANLNAFVKVTQATSPNSSFFFVPEVVKMHLSMKQSDEAAQQLAMWWSAVEQLPHSTPTAWIERCLRMQRIAYICVIMKHTSRQRFLAECQNTILEPNQPRYRIHHAIAALFQLMLVEELDAGTMVTHPLYQTVTSVVHGMINGERDGKQEGERVLFAHEQPSNNNNTAYPTSGVLNCAALRIQNVHFLGYVLRSLVSSVPTKLTSPMPAELVQHARRAAALQLHHNIHFSLLSNKTSSSKKDNPVTLLDVACNRQLLEDLNGVDDVFVRCAIAASLLRYAAPAQDTLRLNLCNPLPTYPSEYLSAMRSLLDSISSSTLTTSSLRAVHAVSWMVLCAVCKSSLWAETCHSELGLRAAPLTSRQSMPLGTLYNDPQTICAVILCISSALRMWTQQPSSSTSSSPRALEITGHVRVIFEVSDLVAAAYPSPKAHSSTAAGLMATNAAFLQGDTSQFITDAIRPAPLSNALGVMLDDVLIPRGQWALAKLVGEFLLFNRSVVKRPSVAGSLKRLQQHENKATSIQKVFRRATGKGLYGDGAAVGSPLWFAALERRQGQMENSALLFASGIVLQEEMVHWRLRRQDVDQREDIIRWTLVLEEEIARDAIKSALTDLMGAQQFLFVEADEARIRFSVLEMETIDETSTLFLDILESEERAARLELESLAASAAGLTGMTMTETTAREAVELDEAASWFLDVLHAHVSEELLLQLVASTSSASHETALLTLLSSEDRDRFVLECEEMEVAVNDLLSAGWCSIMLAAARGTVMGAQAGTEVQTILFDESQVRRELEGTLLITCVEAMCLEWMSTTIAQGLFQQFLHEAYLAPDDAAAMWESLVVPLFTSMLHDTLSFVASSWKHLLSGVRDAQMSTLVEVDEPAAREGVENCYAARAVEWHVDLQSLNRQIISCDEETERHRLTADVAASQQIFSPEIEERCKLLMAEQDQFREGIFYNLAISALHGDVMLRWTRSIEALHRTFLETVLSESRCLAFSSLFSGIQQDDETSSGGTEMMAKLSLGRPSDVIVLKEHFDRRGIFTAFAIGHQRAVMGFEWPASMLNVTAAAEESHRLALQLDASRECNGLMSAAAQQMSHTRLLSLVAAESTARIALADEGHQTLATDVLLEIHEDFLDTLFDVQLAEFAEKFVQRQETVHRSAIHLNALQQHQTALVRCATERRQCLDREFTLIHTRLVKQFFVEKSSLASSHRIAEKQATEWDALLKLESLMRSIAMNLFNMRPKAFLRPSEKAFYVAKRKQEQKRLQNEQKQLQLLLAASPSPLRSEPRDRLGSEGLVPFPAEVESDAAACARRTAVSSKSTPTFEAIESREELHRRLVWDLQAQQWFVMGDAISYLQKGHQELIDYESLQTALQSPSTPPWNDTESDDEEVGVDNGQLSPPVSDIIAMPHRTSPPSVDLDAVDVDDYIPLRFSHHNIPHTTPQETTSQKFRSLLAEESIYREGVVEMERQLSLILAADDREIRETFQDPAYLYYRWCVPQLPWTYQFVVKEAVVHDALHLHYDVPRLSPHILAGHKKFVLLARQLTQKLVSAKTILDRNERTAFRMLLQREALDRADLGARSSSEVSQGSGLLHSRVKGSLPDPPRGGLWRGKHDKNGHHAASANVAGGAAAAIAAARNQSGFQPHTSVLHSYSGVPHAGSYQLGSLPSMASSVQSLPQVVPGGLPPGKWMLGSLATSGSMLLSASGIAGGVGGKSEVDLMLEDWDIRSYKSIFTLENLDDIAPAEQRLRMRLVEVEQTVMVDYLRQLRHLLLSNASDNNNNTLGHSSSGSGVAMNTSALLGSPSLVSTHTGTMPARGDWVNQRSPGAAATAAVAAVGVRDQIATAEDSISRKTVAHERAALQQLNPVDPKGKRRQKQ